MFVQKILLGVKIKANMEYIEPLLVDICQCECGCIRFFLLLVLPMLKVCICTTDIWKKSIKNYYWSAAILYWVSEAISDYTKEMCENMLLRIVQIVMTTILWPHLY